MQIVVQLYSRHMKPAVAILFKIYVDAILYIGLLFTYTILIEISADLFTVTKEIC